MEAERSIDQGKFQVVCSQITDTRNSEPTNLNKLRQNDNLNKINRKKSLWGVETRRILLICSFVVLPMAAFTFTTLWLVFHHRLGAAICPYPQLCSKDSESNMSTTDFANYYYINYPAAQLVFIASFSSSLSFTLVAALMATYSYIIACQFLRLSEKRDKSCPSPYNASILLRILNAETLALIEIIAGKAKDIFWEAKRQKDEPKSTTLLHTSMIVFVLGISASVFIQAADTNLHIATEAVELVRIQPQSAAGLAYSRGLAPWCLNRPSQGSIENVNFWGCGARPASVSIIAQNYTEAQGLNLGLSKVDSFMDFVDENGEYTAIIGPKDVEQTIDWQASSFGVSSQCRAIRNDSCDLSTDPGSSIDPEMLYFNCTKERAGIDISGNMFSNSYQASFLDWHRFIHEQPPFNQLSWSMLHNYTNQFTALAANLSEEDGRKVFSNPFSILSAIEVIERTLDSIAERDTENMLWGWGGFPFGMLVCNVTVWDVEYTLSLSRVTGLNRTLSNSSTTGTASMPMANLWGHAILFMQNAGDEANIAAALGEDFVDAYTKSMSRKFLSILSGQSSPRSALAAQSRSLIIVSKVSKAAVWLLIAANLFFILFAIILTVLALVYSSADAHQVYIRLSIAGLVAQLFDGNYAQQKVKDSYDLFREHAKGEEKVVRKVIVERLGAGGTAMKLV